ncbi:MAG: PD-(D/E)XK nuclease family protein, partial [Pseudomonadota bacterium]
SQDVNADGVPDECQCVADFVSDGVVDFQEVLAVLNDRRLEGCFDPETSRAEVSLAGSVELGGNRRPVLGIIDRLAVFEDRVVVMDYKTGGRTPATAEDVPTVYQRQMALYCEVLKTIYPNRRVEAWLIWTGGAAPVILTLDEELLSRSLETLAPV